jgi:hypothetical protein
LRLAVLIGIVVALIGGAVAIVVSGSPSGLKWILRSDAAATGQGTVSAPIGGRSAATFELVAATTAVALRSDDLGADLYRITTPPDSGLLPRPVVDGDQVRLHLAATTNEATGPVEVVLNSRVAWALRLAGGADELRVDMGRGPVSGVDVVGAARRVEMTLPAARNTVDLKVTSSVDDLVIRAPKENPVRLRLDSGAKTVAAGGKTRRDVEPGSTFTPRGWDVEDRYDVQLAGRVTLVTVEKSDG